METLVARIERIETLHAIEALNTDFCHFLDHNMIEELVMLFTEDARYSHGSRLSIGRGEIENLFLLRIAENERTSRHLQTGLKVTHRGNGRAEGRSVCLTFACDGAPPHSPATPLLVADFIDEYEYCLDGRWRIKKRHIERIFTALDNSGPVGLASGSK